MLLCSSGFRFSEMRGNALLLECTESLSLVVYLAAQRLFTEKDNIEDCGGVALQAFLQAVKSVGLPRSKGNELDPTCI